MLGNGHNGQRSSTAGRSATAQQLVTTQDEDRAGAGGGKNETYSLSEYR